MSWMSGDDPLDNHSVMSQRGIAIPKSAPTSPNVGSACSWLPRLKACPLHSVSRIRKGELKAFCREAGNRGLNRCFPETERDSWLKGKTLRRRLTITRHFDSSFTSRFQSRAGERPPSHFCPVNHLLLSAVHLTQEEDDDWGRVSKGVWPSCVSTAPFHLKWRTETKQL